MDVLSSAARENPMLSVKALVLALSVLAATGAATPGRAGATAKPTADERARAFIRDFERTVKPLIIEANLASWTASLDGTDANFQASEEARNRRDEALSSKQRLAELKGIKEARVRDRVLARQVDLLYLAHLGKQVDPALLQEINARAAAVEKAFTNFRARVAGRELSDSEVREVLKASKDPAERQAAWEASKAVGATLEVDLKALVRLRNQAARKMGFQDHHRMSLFLDEQSQEEVLGLLDQLEERTRGPFQAAKRELDEKLARNFGVKVEDLAPWHYQDPFFQETPGSAEAILDEVYAKTDVVLLAKTFYDGIGLPVGDVLARSDLFERKGKNPHAFAEDVDRAGDVRILTNIVPNVYWASTLFHELGHAVYSSKNIPSSVPFVLRTAAHPLTTEGIATMMGRVALQVDGLRAMGIEVPDADRIAGAAAADRRMELLVFTQWCQVMIRFEAAMYANPDQDLNQLWWSLVERYQGIRVPPGRNAPDYAAKIHFAVAPAYYQNYLLAELFAAQLLQAIAREVTRTEPGKARFHGRKDVGAFLRKRVLAPGATLDWRQLTKLATGEELNAKAFAAEIGPTRP
jgi:peptidyl-dipeptidase A